MKKSLLYFLVIISLSTAFSCGGSKSRKDKIPVNLVVQNNDDSYQKNVKEFFVYFYDRYVFSGEGDFSEIVNQFSDKIVNRLKNEFDYDDGNGYAVWLFRTGAQDGPDNSENASKVYKVTFENDNWCTVYFSDMGYDDTCRFKVEIKNGKVYVIDFEK